MSMFEVFGLLTCLLHSGLAEKSYAGYSVVEVEPQTERQIEQLTALILTKNLEVWLQADAPGDKSHILLKDEQVDSFLGLMAFIELPVDSVVTDVSSLIEEDHVRQKASAEEGIFNYDQFNTYQAILAEMEEMKLRCPPTFSCDVYDIGETAEGRRLTIFKIYKEEDGRVGFWMDSTLHAREWLSTAVNLRIADYLLTQSAEDEKGEARMLLDAGDWYFLFVANPDGYAYTWQEDGDRLWRKNRNMNNGSECIGVDLNRNFATNWGDVDGSSGDPCAATYRGETAASELETRAIQDELRRLGPSLKAMWSIHTYGQYYLMPWGVRDKDGKCKTVVEPDNSQMTKVVNAMADATEKVFNTKWKRGNACNVLNPASGVTVDFAYAEAGIKFSFSPELRGRFAGFLTLPSEIRPAFEESLAGLVAMVTGITE